MKNKEKYLVTGGAGFIGTNLIKHLLKKGHEVICFDNYSTGSKDNEQNGCTYFDIDLSKIKDYNFLESKPDVIFHLAALARIEPSFELIINSSRLGLNLIASLGGIMKWIPVVTSNPGNRCGLPLLYHPEFNPLPSHSPNGAI